jgi:galactonate dehydratase
MTTIESFDIFLVQPRWVFLKLETADGTVGWGEAGCPSRVTVIREAIRDLLENDVVGLECDSIEQTWDRLYHRHHYRGGPIHMSAIAAIDQALWDIKGKHLGTPVHELLGGPVREELVLYGGVTLEFQDKIPAEVFERDRVVLKTSSRDMPVLEAGADLRALLDMLEEFCSTVPDHAEVGLDLRGRTATLDPGMLARELDAYDLAFVEEPFPPERMDDYRSFGTTAETAVAGGERHYKRESFSRLLDRDALDILQPDVAHAGGITECRKIFDLADTRGHTCIPTWSLGPISLAASIQLSMAASNVPVHPGPFHANHRKTEYFEEMLESLGAIETTDGRVVPVDEPGLGITVDESAVRDLASSEVVWQSDVHEHDDGRVTDA